MECAFEGSLSGLLVARIETYKGGEYIISTESLQGLVFYVLLANNTWYVIFLYMGHIYLRSLGRRSVCVCFHIKPVFPPVDIQHNRCPCRFFNPLSNTGIVVTKLRHSDSTLPRMQ